MAEMEYSTVGCRRPIISPFPTSAHCVSGFAESFVSGSNANNLDAASVWVHNDCFDVDDIRPEEKLLGNKKHGVNWTEQDARALAKAEGIPQGKFGSMDDLNYITEQVKKLGDDTGRIASGIKDPIPLPKGHTSRVYNPDGSSVEATHVWVRVNKGGRGTVHMYPMVIS